MCNFGLGLLLQLKHQMACLVYTAQLYCIIGYVGWGYKVVALYVGIGVDEAQVEHLVNQSGYALAVFNYFLTNQLQFVAVNLDILVSQHLCEARQHIEWRANLVRNLLDELRFHAV